MTQWTEQEALKSDDADMSQIIFSGFALMLDDELCSSARRLSRAQWVKLYRAIRVNRREQAKSFVDLLLFGQSAMAIDAGRIEHIPIEKLVTAYTPDQKPFYQKLNDKHRR